MSPTATLRQELKAAAQDHEYHRRVGEALDRARERATRGTALDIESDRFVIFSDQHKGARNGADDFRRCERAYNAALAYYFARGYALVELGDVEELWEERPSTVIKKYRHTLELSARFSSAGRYYRIWGNHDDLWSFPKKAASMLGPIFGEGLQVHEALILEVREAGQPIGEVMLAHGHQGSVTSDRWSQLSRIPVRYVWRNIQRLFNISLNTPANDWALRERHNIAMHAWSARQQGTVLIAGHTHRPVFLANTLAEELHRQVQEAEVAESTDAGNPELTRQVAALSAELEWARAQDLKETGPEGAVSTHSTCYFNTGCCAFLDGDITGIEIADRMIRLIRWPSDDGSPLPQVLASQTLTSLFPKETRGR